MIDWLWAVAAIILTASLAGNLAARSWAAHRRRIEANRQKTFQLSMRLPDRMKLDLR